MTLYIHWWCCQITQLLLISIDTALSLELICSIVVGELSLTVTVKNYNFGDDDDFGKNYTGDDDDDDDDGKDDTGVRDMLLVSGDYH